MEIKKFRIRKVNEIGRAGLEGNEDVVLLFRELLYSFPKDKWKDGGEDEICDYIRFFESETDRIAKGDEKKNFTESELDEQKKYEEYCLSSEDKEIKKLFTTLSKVDF